MGKVLAYSGTLTTAQRQAVEAYLEYQWFGTGSPSYANNVLPTAYPVNITTAGATLDLNGNNQAISSLSGVAASQVYLEAGALTTGDSTSTQFAGNISGAGGSLVKVGNGTFTLSGTNTYTGATEVNGGMLVLANLGTTSGGSIHAVGGNVYIGGSPLGAWSSAGTLQLSGSGNDQIPDTAAVWVYNGQFDLHGMSEVIDVLGGGTAGLITNGSTHAQHVDGGRRQRQRCRLR